MPYNSSAFEKQLAKFKEQQAVKASSEEKLEDAHVTKPRIEVGCGTINPAAVEPLSVVPQEKEEPIIPAPVIEAAKKPFYKQGWFMFLLFSAVTSGAMPIVFKGQMDEMMGMANSVHATSGVDMFSPETYKKIFSGQALTANRHQATEQPATPKQAEETPIKKIVSRVKAEATAKSEVIKTKIEQAQTPAVTQPPQDIHDIVNMATQKAQEVTAQGPEKSMEYIESEAKRLEEMAKQFDQTYGNKK
ncbi:MAG: hypothetical protein EBQ96_08875 [Proteobacteria bacterium]|nr:hypothetical protein [Pseudomonadota bacterium]